MIEEHTLLNISYSSKFKRDAKRMQKRGKVMKKLEELIDRLAERKPLPRRFKDHTLIGNYAHRRECHIEPDWLLIYKLEDHCIFLERTGSHADLFK